MIRKFRAQTYLHSIGRMRDDYRSWGDIIFSRSISEISLTRLYRQAAREIAPACALDKISLLFHLHNPQHSSGFARGAEACEALQVRDKSASHRLKLEFGTFELNQG